MASTRPDTRPDAPRSPGDESRGAPMPGVWLHLVCCGAPLLIILALAVGASARVWLAIPAGIAAAVNAAVLVARRRRCGDRGCCAPRDNAETAGTASAPQPHPARDHTSADQVPVDRWLR
jgi:hypothetical protein